MTRKKPISKHHLSPIRQALVVHYSTHKIGDPVRKETIVLCDRHRSSFYSFHPEACGYGEYRPVEECAYCVIDVPHK